MSKTPGRTIDVTIRYQHRSPGHDRDDRFAARFSSHDVPREFVEATPQPCIDKPFSLATLTQVIDEVLGRSDRDP